MQPEEIARAAGVAGDPMRSGNQSSAQQLGEQIRIELIGFDFGGGDRLI